MALIDLVNWIDLNDLTQMVNFPTQMSDRDSHSPALLDLFLSSDAIICCAMAFPLLGNSGSCGCSSFHRLSFKLKTDAPFHRIADDYSRADWDSLRYHLRDVPWKDMIKLSPSDAVSEFCEWVPVGIDAYIPNCNYQVKPHSWFSAACAAAIVHRNHFFHLYCENKSSESKGKFRQASNRCKRIIEAAKLAYANKTRVHHTPETWLSGLLAIC